MNKTMLVLVSIAVVACSGDGDHEDLRQWMNESVKGVRGRIPPLPQVKPYEPVSYDVGNRVDPFKPAKIGLEKKTAGSGGLQPDLERPREPLEAYPLESLKYVGSMEKKKAAHAIVQVDGSLFNARVGNYMGQNFGVVTKITESELTLKELVQDSSGDWVERVSALLLQEQEGKK